MHAQKLIHSRQITAFYLIVAATVILINSWICDDAFITMRSVEQVFAGNGPRWNPHERVQAFTHPLWFIVLLFARLFSKDPIIVPITVGALCSLSALFVLFKSVKFSPEKCLMTLALALSSRTWIDFSTSGLENPLSFLLLSLFITFTLKSLTLQTGKAIPYLCFSLLLLCRYDNIFLTLPLFVGLYSKSSGSWKQILWGFLPLFIWIAFSTFYYGSPLPNTTFAKLSAGISRRTLIEQGVHYLLNLIRWDPIAPLVILGGTVSGLLSRNLCFKAISLGIILHIIYTLLIGGDFMAGRFISYPYWASLSLLTFTLPRPMCLFAVCAAVLFVILSPNHPLRQVTTKPLIDRFGIADEKSVYWSHTSLRHCLSSLKAGRKCPNHMWRRKGEHFRNSSKAIRVKGTVGMFGYYAGTQKIVIDICGLGDPLLSRIPAKPIKHRIGHFVREIPEGYKLSVTSGKNMIKDPSIRDLYATTRIVTQERLFSWQRLKKIVKLNAQDVVRLFRNL
ncbi:MAG: hypothetical protein D6808_00995 [Candidatus Dadabacteria bacterium]|nr:MAG: hypothetical protein D6808_00995 [Candidatus Dadabacteria bacterium]